MSVTGCFRPSSANTKTCFIKLDEHERYRVLDDWFWIGNGNVVA